MTRDKLFDILFSLAQKQIEEINPCKFKDGKCRRDRLDGCCYGETPSKKHVGRTVCKYLNEDAECTIKCLGCKTYLCLSYGTEGMSTWSEKIDWHELSGYLQAIRDIAAMCGISTACFITKEEAIERMSRPFWAV